MTAHRDLKRIIRERQSKTGESYTAARVHVMRERVALLGVAAPEPIAQEPLRIDAAVLKINRQSARVRISGESGQLTFRSRDVCEVVPGHLVTLVIEARLKS
jgi:preprotein translocase subunit SecD